MSIPSANKLHRPILEFLKRAQKECSLRDTINEMSRFFDLSLEEKNKLTTVAKRKVFDTHVSWAVSNLRHANFLHSVKLGTFEISPKGIAVLLEHDRIFDIRFLLNHSKEFRDWKIESDENRKIVKKPSTKDFISQYGIVIFIDILGTKGIWKTKDHEELGKIHSNWSQLNNGLKEILDEVLSDENVHTHLGSFSDTTIITITFDEKNLDNVISKLGRGLWRSITESMQLDLPIRGCFSVGTFYRKDDFFIGPAIDEAAEYYSFPQWIGISASTSCNYEIERISKINFNLDQIYHKCDIPLKESIEQNAWAVNWPQLLDEDIQNIDSDTNNEDLTNIYNKIEKNLLELRDLSASLKWRNTKKFLEDYLNQ